MSYKGPSIVDLTDDHESTSHSTTSRQIPNQTQRGGSSYTTSPINPAKRSRIDTTNMSPLALLNPRAFVANGAIQRKSNDRDENQSEPRREPISYNKRIEALHGIKDRKTKALPISENRRDSNPLEAGDQRRSGTSLLSKNIIASSPSTEFIDLTGLLFLLLD